MWGSACPIGRRRIRMDNMKARGFVESEMPLPSARNQEGQDRLDDLAKQLVESADQVASLLRSAVRNALFSPGATVKLDAALLSAVRERLWEETETRFFTMMAAVSHGEGEASDLERVGWRDHLRAAALALFDEAAPLSANSGGSAGQPALAKPAGSSALRSPDTGPPARSSSTHCC